MTDGDFPCVPNEAIMLTFHVCTNRKRVCAMLTLSFWCDAVLSHQSLHRWSNCADINIITHCNILCIHRFHNPTGAVS